MARFDSLESKEFQRKLYLDLDEKLKSTSWNSGASEAHGLLTGLACRCVSAGEVTNKMYLLQISEPADKSLLQGMFELILRDLDSQDLTFNLLLPGDQADNFKMAEELSNWCEGFLQGFCHDGDSFLQDYSDFVLELVNDLFNIADMKLDSVEERNEDDEKSLIEIEEYLRVGIQLVYDENAGNMESGSSYPSSEIH